MTHEHDNCGGPCAVSFAELRQRALDEFLEGVGVYPADAAWALERQLKKIDRAEQAARERDERLRLDTEATHDRDALIGLADKMEAKLHETRKRRGGWWTDGCTVEALSQMLHAVVAKGDPVDVANYCAFIAAKGGKIAPISTATAEGLKGSADRPSAQDLGDALATVAFAKHKADRAEVVTDESGVSVGAGAGRLVPRMPADAPLADRQRELAPALRDGSSLLRPATSVRDHIADKLEAMGDKQAANVLRAVPPALLPAGYLVGAAEFAGELLKARRKFPTQASAHEGFAIIAEELDELKAIVWQKQSERDYAALRKETIQLGAMVLAFLLEVVNPENRR